MRNIFICLVILYFLAPTVVHAGSIYLSPASRTISPGTTFNVAVRENSGGDAVNAVTASLTYPADLLDFVGISAGGSAFSIDAPSGGGGGAVNINRGTFNGVTGDKLISSVTFRVKVGATGTASIQVGGGSALVRASDQANVFGGGAGGNYIIGKSTAPAPTSASSKSSQQSTTQTTKFAAPIPTPDLNPLIISDVSTTAISFNTVTVEWKTNRNSTSVVQYGLNKDYGLTFESEGLITEHRVLLKSPLLVPGTTFHYRVISKDTAETEAASPDNTFTTNGMEVYLIVHNDKGRILANTKVELVTPQGSKITSTNANGTAVFKNVPPATMAVIAHVNDKTYASTLEVKAPTQEEILNGKAKPQSVTIKVAGITLAKQDSTTILLLIIVLFLALLVIIPIVIHKRKIKQQNMLSIQPTPDMSTDTSIQNS